MKKLFHLLPMIMVYASVLGLEVYSWNVTRRSYYKSGGNISFYILFLLSSTLFGYLLYRATRVWQAELRHGELQNRIGAIKKPKLFDWPIDLTSIVLTGSVWLCVASGLRLGYEWIDSNIFRTVGLSDGHFVSYRIDLTELSPDLAKRYREPRGPTLVPAESYFNLSPLTIRSKLGTYSWAVPLYIPILLSGGYLVHRIRRNWLMRRSWIRQERGLCLICGYDLRGCSGRCPECGAPIVIHGSLKADG